MKKKMKFPAKDSDFRNFTAGSEVEISGTIYVARDAAHKKLVETVKMNRPLPFEIKGSLIYYMGPSPAPAGKVIGSCGPTTSSRMDNLTIPLLEKGLKATMGKGNRDKKITVACRKYNSLYLVTYGGCGAYLHQFVEKSEVIAYPELGPEAVYRLEVKNFPAIVGIDIKGNNIYNK